MVLYYRSILLSFYCAILAAQQQSVLYPANRNATMSIHDYQDRHLKDKHGAAKELTLGPPGLVLPSVFILGVQKGGSSSMMWELITHPQLCDGERKETHFFLGFSYGSKIDEGKSIEEIKTEYLAIFRDKKCVDIPNTMFIDGTPVLHHLEVAGNMNSFYGNLDEKDKLKFIIMLREPVSRDYSWYQHKIRQHLTGHITGQGFDESRKGAIADMQTFKEMYESHINDVNRGKLARSDIPIELAGDYITQILEFAKHFRRDQMFIINSNEAYTHTADTMEAVRQFLGVEPHEQWNTDPFPHDDLLGTTYHSSDPDCVLKHIPKMDCSFRDKLAAFYASKNKELEQWMSKTKKKGPPMEPNFTPFGTAYKNISCVPDARAALDAVVELEKKETC